MLYTKTFMAQLLINVPLIEWSLFCFREYDHPSNLVNWRCRIKKKQTVPNNIDYITWGYLIWFSLNRSVGVKTGIVVFNTAKPKLVTFHHRREESECPLVMIKVCNRNDDLFFERLLGLKIAPDLLELIRTTVKKTWKNCPFVRPLLNISYLSCNTL